MSWKGLRLPALLAPELGCTCMWVWARSCVCVQQRVTGETAAFNGLEHKKVHLSCCDLLTLGGTWPLRVGVTVTWDFGLWLFQRLL